MKTVEITKAKQSLASYARQVKKNPVVVTRDGKPMAALVGLSNSDWESVSLSNNPRFLELIERSRNFRKRNGSLTLRQLRKRLGLQKKHPAKKTRTK